MTKTKGFTTKDLVIAKAKENKPPSVIVEELKAAGIKTTTGNVMKELSKARKDNPTIPNFNKSDSPNKSNAAVLPANSNLAKAEHEIVKKTLKGDYTGEILLSPVTAKLGPERVIRTSKLVEPFRLEPTLLERMKVSGSVSQNANTLGAAFEELIRTLAKTQHESEERGKQVRSLETQVGEMKNSIRVKDLEIDEYKARAMKAEYAASIQTRLIKEHGLSGFHRLMIQLNNLPKKKEDIEQREKYLQIKLSYFKQLRDSSKIDLQILDRAIKIALRPYIIRIGHLLTIREGLKESLSAEKSVIGALRSNPTYLAVLLELVNPTKYNQIVREMNRERLSQFRSAIDEVEIDSLDESDDDQEFVKGNRGLISEIEQKLSEGLEGRYFRRRNDRSDDYQKRQEMGQFFALTKTSDFDPKIKRLILDAILAPPSDTLNPRDQFGSARKERKNHRTLGTNVKK